MRLSVTDYVAVHAAVVIVHRTFQDIAERSRRVSSGNNREYVGDTPASTLMRGMRAAARIPQGYVVGLEIQASDDLRRPLAPSIDRVGIAEAG